MSQRRNSFIPLLSGILMSSVSVATWAGSPAPRPGTLSSQHPSPVELLRRQPMSFEANTGQTDNRVKFLARGQGYSLFLTPTEAVLSMAQSDSATARPKPTKNEVAGPKSPALLAHERNEQLRRDAMQRIADNHKPRGLSVLRMKLRGANSNAQMSGVGKLAGTSNYLNGCDTQKWRTGVAHYARVQYKSVYPGIDMVYYGTGEKLEYDFIVAPGADPSRIRINFDGARSVRINRTGDLVLAVGKDEVIQHAPVIYQERDGRRQRIAGRYALNRNASGNAEIGFRLAAYDKTKPLVIDPILSYLTYVGGSEAESGQAAFIGTTGIGYSDSSGNIFLYGTTASLNFPTTTGAYDRTKAGDEFSDDIFITKLNSSGGAVFSTFLGGDNTDYPSNLTLVPDNSGNIQLTGSTTSSNFPTTTGAFQRTLGDEIYGDTFVARLNSTGTTLVYSTLLGGDGLEYGSAQFLPSGEVLVTGSTNSTNFPTTTGAFDRTFGGGVSQYGFGPANDVFITKLNSSGGAVFSTYLGGSGDEQGYVLNNGADGFILQGTTRASNFPTTVGAFDRTYGGGDDLFLCKLNTSGSGLVFSTFFGGSGEDSGSFYLTEAGALLGTGGTPSPDFPTTSGAFDSTHNGSKDGWVAKFTTSGAITFSTLLGGIGEEDLSYAFAQPDNSGNLLFINKTTSSNFPTTAGAFDRTYGGGGDLFVTKLNASGSALVFSSFFGGSGAETGYGLPDSSGNIVLVGTTTSSNLSVANAVRSTYGGNTDAFAAKFNPTASGLIFSTYLGGSGQETNGVTYGALTDGNLLLVGSTTSTNFPVSSTALQKTFGGVTDGYVTKLSSTGGLVFSTYFGGNGNETLSAQPLVTGTVVLSGTTASTSGFPLKNAFQTNYGGGESDTFVAKLSSSGSAIYSTYLGGNGDDSGSAFAESSGVIYLVGDTTSSNLPTTSGAFRSTYGGQGDLFAAKIVDGTGESDDSIAPTVAITTPANGASVSTFTSITGTASDNTGGSGVQKVEVALRRDSDLKFWNGSSWASTTLTKLPVSSFSAGNWSKTTGLPTGANVTGGGYVVYAYATDNASNTKSTYIRFTVASEATPPSVAITTPAASAGVTALPAISGTASDSGSGLRKVEVALRRNSDRLFWNGSSWATTAVVKLAATVSGTSWTKNSGLPSGTALLDGAYVAYAYATDNAGNVQSVYNSFVVDRVVPNLAITTPASGTTVASLASIAGTTSDNTGGSGVVRIQVALRRNSDLKFWNGSSWATTAVVKLGANFSGTSWNRSSGLPSGSNLANGTYVAYAYATDKAGNVKSAFNSFTVNSAGAEAEVELSSVILSSASASADGTVRLVFSGALNQSVLDAGNYALTQNSGAVEVISVQQPNATTVVLQADGLATGERVAVNYNLQDAQGRSLSGTATVVVK